MVARVKLKIKSAALEKKQTYPGARRGPKSTYLPQFSKVAGVLCSRGATNADLADAFSVTTMTVQNWMGMYPEFDEAVRRGKAEIFDPKVERALAQRALGYSVDTEEIRVLKDGEVIRVPVRKHYPPETLACIFWLKNRKPEQWRDVQNHLHSGKVENLTAAELLAEIRRMLLGWGFFRKHYCMLVLFQTLRATVLVMVLVMARQNINACV